ILFYSFFKSLVGKVVELKNELSICGYVSATKKNLQLADIGVTDLEKYPTCCLSRTLQADEVDTQLLQDAAHEVMQQ
uniref:Uncharacterized protein n=1 Tax=Chelydra serpentina TaxID=8475 RepID=A0A8C3RRI4_CHESE